MITASGIPGMFRAHGPSAVNTVRSAVVPRVIPSKLTLKGTDAGLVALLVMLYTAALRMYVLVSSFLPTAQYAGPKAESAVEGRVVVIRVLEKSLMTW